MHAPPRFATPPERLVAPPIVLRRLRVAHAEAVARAVSESRDHLRPWMPWAANDESVDPGFQRTRIAGAERDWDAGTEYGYVMFDAADGEESTVVGACSMMRRVGPRAIEIGYFVHVDHTGRGCATAAAKALTDAALALTDVDRVEIHCDEANVRSAAVPRRLGYRLDRVEDDGIAAPGETGRGMVWVLERGAAG